jgi:hypothetical protein
VKKLVLRTDPGHVFLAGWYECAFFNTPPTDAMKRPLPSLAIEITLLALMLATTGCFLDYWAYHSAGGGKQGMIGEQHEIDFPATDARVMTQNALRGQGILFDVEPNDEIITLWQNANIPVNPFASLVGIQPRYRYDIQVVPDGSRKAKIIVNVEGDNIPQDQIASYKASTRYHLFDEIDKLASAAPPPSLTPKSGGVNYALLPGEDLKGLAKRVTGSADNWKVIAKQNGLKSPSDVSPAQTIWVPDYLLKPAPKAATGAPGAS